MNLSRDFDRHLRLDDDKANQVNLRKGATWALHLIVGVSPAWVKQGGDPHDKDTNPRIGQLVEAATKWAEQTIGGVWHVRYDVDEEGSAIVDVICSPVRKNARSGKPFVSVRAPLVELAKKYGHLHSKSYSGVQDSWAEYAQEHLDPTLLRGRPAKETKRKNLTPEEYKEMLAAIDAANERAAQIVREASEEANDQAAEILRSARAAAAKHMAEVKTQALEVVKHLGKRVRQAVAEARQGSKRALAAYQALQRLAGVPEHRVLIAAEIAFTSAPSGPDRSIGHSGHSFHVVDNRGFELDSKLTSTKGDVRGVSAAKEGAAPPGKPTKKRRQKGPKL